jgi:hypothetical protein
MQRHLSQLHLTATQSHVDILSYAAERAPSASYQSNGLNGNARIFRDAYSPGGFVRPYATVLLPLSSILIIIIIKCRKLTNETTRRRCITSSYDFNKVALR